MDTRLRPESLAKSEMSAAQRRSLPLGCAHTCARRRTPGSRDHDARARRERTDQAADVPRQTTPSDLSPGLVAVDGLQMCCEIPTGRGAIKECAAAA
jgi:hypothetical protein